MLKGQQLSSLRHSTASGGIKIANSNPNKLNVSPRSARIAPTKATRPVQCNVTKKETAGISSKLVAKASKTVDSWLSEDFDFNNFYGEDGTKNERSVSCT